MAIDKQPPTQTASKSRWITLGVCAFLAAAVWFTFDQTLHFDFVNFDDDGYVYSNPATQRGLTGGNFAQAWTQVCNSNWHPLTMLSHMLDCQLYGLNPGKHHLTNVLIHTATAILLFLVLRTMTGALWPSAFVAAVFAIHPLRVESVAWISERKDVLSGLFFMLTLGAYLRYVRKPSVGRYLPVMAALALGLMSKSMLVTVPFLLLLLDYWPLRRYATEGENPLLIPRRLWLEKTPLLALSAIVCAVTVLAQHRAIDIAQGRPLSQRIVNTFVSYVIYLKQTFYPAKLAILYPYPVDGHPVWKVALALVLLAVISAAAFHWRRNRPWLWTGWLWYLGMLVPVIGLLQVGHQAHADRYTYLPQIGLLVALTWTAAKAITTWQNRHGLLGGATAGILAALILTARAQVAHWQDSKTLWVHAIACTSDQNALARCNLENFLLEQGRLDEAAEQARKTLAIWPDNAASLNTLGMVGIRRGRTAEAIACFRAALKSDPDFIFALVNLGGALQYEGQLEESVRCLQRALQIDPRRLDAHNNLGLALEEQGQVALAIAHFQKAIEIKPDSPEAMNNLAWVLATSPKTAFRNGQRAVELAIRVNQLTGGGNPIILRTLAAAYAETGQFSDASRVANQALQLATARSNALLAQLLQNDILLYRSGQPLYDIPPPR